MGKKSKYPAYSGGSVKVNGRKVASISKKNGSINSSYKMSKTEKKIYNTIQKNLKSSLKNLNNFEADKKLWQQQLNAYKDNGIKEINSIYTPMETSLKNDISGRFGNLDNSVFLNKLANITDNKAQAVASLSNSLLAKQDELYKNELANRLNYISLLSGLDTNMNNRMLSLLGQAQSNSGSGNSYAMNAYNANSNNGSFLTDALSVAAKAFLF
ncbi:hypothetical protein IKR55_05250 [bacterium]|nr:hypothetical protein [bacterium]